MKCSQTIDLFRKYERSFNEDLVDWFNQNILINIQFLKLCEDAVARNFLVEIISGFILADSRIRKLN